MLTAGFNLRLFVSVSKFRNDNHRFCSCWWFLLCWSGSFRPVFVCWMLIVASKWLLLMQWTINHGFCQSSILISEGAVPFFLLESCFRCVFVIHSYVFISFRNGRQIVSSFFVYRFDCGYGDWLWTKFVILSRTQLLITL